jgi:leader peptidase (prepilin peptidase) / N-methyltransferase
VIETSVVVLATILGLAFGSFLNVVIWRVPAGRSLVRPGSACPNCGAAISPRDNVPILSWLMLRGKCRHCAEPISARYPLVEAFTAVSFGLVALGAVAGVYPTAFALPLTYFAAISIALALIDLDTHTLPNAIVLPAYPVLAGLLVVASFVSNDWPRMITAVAGAAILFGFYFLLAIISPRGMGFGDVKLAGVIGMLLGWLGWGPLAIGGFSAFLLGGAFSIILILLRLANRKGGIPFGPWMIAGAFVGVVFGDPLIEAYLGALGIG